jgi:hypothetical protein
LFPNVVDIFNESNALELNDATSDFKEYPRRTTYRDDSIGPFMKNRLKKINKAFGAYKNIMSGTESESAAP